MIIDISNVDVTVNSWRHEPGRRGPRHVARFTATTRDGAIFSGEIEPWAKPVVIGPSDLLRTITRRDDDVEIVEAIRAAARKVVPRVRFTR